MQPACGRGAAVQFLSFPRADTGVWVWVKQQKSQSGVRDNKVIFNSLYLEQYMYFIMFKMLCTHTNHKEISVA